MALTAATSPGGLFDVAACRAVQRLLVLLALFAGLGQREIASMRREEFDLAKQRLTHCRNKTGVKGLYRLPYELVDLIGPLDRAPSGSGWVRP